MLYDNRTNASEMENHAVRPEIAAAEKNGTGEDNRLSETFAKQTFYYAVRLKTAMSCVFPQLRTACSAHCRMRRRGLC